MANVRYDFQPLNTLKPGQQFMFANGGTINVVIVRTRDELIYQNIITMKCTRIRLFPVGAKSWPLRYAKSMTRMFEKYYSQRKELEDLPF